MSWLKMSSSQKDPSLRVAANDPHLVSLGGGRLSTAVTIHNIPIGRTTIGTSSSCCIVLCGSGVQPLHCSIDRSAHNNDVTLEPESNALILIDGRRIMEKVHLMQGATITIGDSYYLRFNNPAEAQFIRSVIRSQEDVSKEQKDLSTNFIKSFQEPYNKTKVGIDLNSWQCPKVFTSDLVTVNMPAKDVLGQKYVNFAKNLAENHRSEKNINHRICFNNHVINQSKKQLQTQGKNSELLAKVNNTSSQCNVAIPSSYDVRSAKTSVYGNKNADNTNEMNNSLRTMENLLNTTTTFTTTTTTITNDISINREQERLEDILKICKEYTDRQAINANYGSSFTASPIVQNRIKTNGSLPREKKSPFCFDFSNSSSNLLQNSLTDGCKFSYAVDMSMNATKSAYENVQCSEKNQSVQSVGSNFQNLNPRGNDNISLNRYVPKSPRTKIRTTCMSPKKDTKIDIFHNIFNMGIKHDLKNDHYEQLIKNFKDKFHMELQTDNNEVINITEQDEINSKNLTLNLKSTSKYFQSVDNAYNYTLQPESLPIELSISHLNISDTSQKKELVDQKLLNIILIENDERKKTGDLDLLQLMRKDILERIQVVKCQIVKLEKQENDILNEINMESAFLSTKLDLVDQSKSELQNNLEVLQQKIFRLEAQRNATRVMEENKQAKFKQCIEMKQDQIQRLMKMLQENTNDPSLKEELYNVSESLENDRKMFEDLEFQYFEEESEWHAYREELHLEEKALELMIEEKRMEAERLQIKKSEQRNNVQTSNNIKILNENLLSVLKDLSNCKDSLKMLENSFHEITAQLKMSPCSNIISNAVLTNRVNDNSINSEDHFSSNISQLFGSTDLVYPKQNNMKTSNDDTMSQSFNENFVYNNNNNIEMHLNVDLEKPANIKNLNTVELLEQGDLDIKKLKNVTEFCKQQEPYEKKDENILTENKNPSSKIFDSIQTIERNRLLLIQHDDYSNSQCCSDVVKDVFMPAQVFDRRQDSISNIKDVICRCGSTPRNESISKGIEEIKMPNSMQQNKENYNLTKSSFNSLKIKRYSLPEFGRNGKKSYNVFRPLSETNTKLKDSITVFLNENSLNAKNDKIKQITNNTITYNKNNSNSNHSDTSSERKKILPRHQRPLTRYLPIFSSDFDLKQHIESAGHQISLCPHVIIDTHSCKGYLHKLGATFHGWSRRWFVMDRKLNALIYYSDKSERKPRGGAYFSTIMEVYLDHLNASKSGRPHCTFVIKTKKRTYQLQAASCSAARIWIDALITGAQGSLDYQNI